MLRDENSFIKVIDLMSLFLAMKQSFFIYYTCVIFSD
jgi:hypothetical protein